MFSGIVDLKFSLKYCGYVLRVNYHLNIVGIILSLIIFRGKLDL